MSFKIFAVLTLSSLFASAAFAQETFVARLRGPGEVPLVLSTGMGHARVTISDDGQSIQYELTYSGLEGSKVPDAMGNPGKVLFAHIHVGKPTDSGGVVLFFCGGGNTPATQVACPTPDGGTVSGTWTAADIRPVTTQGVDPSDANQNTWERIVKAIRAGFTYANVHTTRSPGGEIRGQLFRAHERD